MKVLIIMGSKSDLPIMVESKSYLDWFGIESELVVASAHRNPDLVKDIITSAEKNGFGAVIAAAGMAAALPGVCAAYTTLPVLGVPLEGGLQGGIDALFSIVQMPAGVPVGTFAVGKAGARNAAVMSARIFALGNKSIREKLDEFSKADYKIG
jgi:5-(carboxyamino)imidazole ribonucleotide mutase